MEGLWSTRPTPSSFIPISGHKGHINSLNIGGLNKFFKKIGRKCNLSYLLVLETMFPLDLRSKVCMASFHVRRKVYMCGVRFQVSGVRCQVLSSKHLHSQTVRAGELKFLQDVHLPRLVTCHVSCGICHVSQVICHKSHVTCHMSSSCHISLPNQESWNFDGKSIV